MVFSYLAFSLFENTVLNNYSSIITKPFTCMNLSDSGPEGKKIQFFFYNDIYFVIMCLRLYIFSRSEIALKYYIKYIIWQIYYLRDENKKLLLLEF